MSAQIVKKTRKKTNANQFKKLVELMECNQDLAKFGSSKRESMGIWETFGVELNSLEPPYRKGNEWNKVWLDYKTKLKAKIAAHKNEIKGTGGGPHIPLTLSPLEQAVDALLGLQSAVDPTGRVFGPNSYNPPANEEDIPGDERQEENEDNAPPQGDTPIHNKQHKVPKTEIERLEFLKTQTATQDKLLEATQGMEKCLNEIARFSRKTYEVKKEQLGIMKAKEKRKLQENADKNRCHQENMEIKIKKINLKAAKYDIGYDTN